MTYAHHLQVLSNGPRGGVSSALHGYWTNVFDLTKMTAGWKLSDPHAFDVCDAQAAIDKVLLSKATVPQGVLSAVVLSNPDAIPDEIHLAALKTAAKIGHICVVCSKAARHRCSKCNSEFYCGAACQKRAWKTHKLKCVGRSTRHQLQDDVE